MPRLYVVATPIGNLQDLSPRALETLRNVSFIAAEDTRVTMKLCQVFDIHTPLVSCHMHNEESKGAELAERMIRDQADAALVTDAGTPCVSDPGHLFVRACTQRGIEVLPVPGPVACAAALSVSGMECREWKFYGFLPREKKGSGSFTGFCREKRRNCGMHCCGCPQKPALPWCMNHPTVFLH